MQRILLCRWELFLQASVLHSKFCPEFCMEVHLWEGRNNSHVAVNCCWTVANKPIQSCFNENVSSVASSQGFIASLSGLIN